MEEVEPSSWPWHPTDYRPPVGPDQIAPVTDWKCRVCGGKWLRNFVFAHKATCRVYKQDSATQFADYSRLARSRTRGFTRRISPSELTATCAFAPEWFTMFTTEDLPTTEVRRTKNGHHRVAAGFDPDKIAKLLAVKDENND